MEDQAPYGSVVPSSDLRELAAPVAAWLAGLGFQVYCGPLPDCKTTDVLGVWRSASGSVFDFALLAQQNWACCQCGERIGTHVATCFSWTDVQDLAQVQWLVGQNRQFRQAQASASRAAAAPAAAHVPTASAPGTSPPAAAP